jgi:putative membrane protein insertion efficiency factor
MGAYFAGPPHRNKRVCAASGRSAAVTAALFALRCYKAYLSILFAGSCRFEPTCSQYSYEAIERFGLARGTWLTLKRLARCQPFSRRFGSDPVPEDWPVPENLEESRPQAPAQNVCHPAAASHEVPT